MAAWDAKKFTALSIPQNNCRKACLTAYPGRLTKLLVCFLLTVLRGQGNSTCAEKGCRGKKRLTEWLPVVFEGDALPFSAKHRGGDSARGSKEFVFQWFDRAIFSRQIYEMEIEFSVIIDGGDSAKDSALQAAVFGRIFGKSLWVWRLFFPGKPAFLLAARLWFSADRTVHQVLALPAEMAIRNFVSFRSAV